MTGTSTQAGRRRWDHVQEHVLAGAALQLLNGEAPALKASTQDHLGRCERCAARLEELRAVLAGERRDGEEAADAAFSDARLRAQRSSILARLERARAGARVLAFPTSGAWMVRRDRPAMRWLAAAAAAGLLVGLGAGQLVSVGHQLRSRSTAVIAARDFAPALWVGSTSVSAPRIEHLNPAAEEAFLSEMESALNNRRIAALRALDDLTPRPADAPRRRK